MSSVILVARPSGLWQGMNSSSAGAYVSPRGERATVSRAAQPAVADRLLEASLVLFLERGYNGTSLQMIADALGVTKAAIYYHHKTKEELLAALMEPATAELTGLLDEVEAAGAKRRPGNFVERYVDFLLTHRGVVALGSRDATINAHPVVRESAEKIRERLLSLLAGGRLSFETGVQIAAALGALNTVVAAFPETDSAALRPAMINIARTLLPTRRITGGSNEVQ